MRRQAKGSINGTPRVGELLDEAQGGQCLVESWKALA
jgi:hypothetical protein